MNRNMKNVSREQATLFETVTIATHFNLRLALDEDKSISCIIGNQSMKAVVITRFGGPEVLEVQEVPHDTMTNYA